MEVACNSSVRRAEVRRLKFIMYFFVWSGLGWLVGVGGMLVLIVTEVTMRSIAPAVMMPHSWWLMSGYVAAGLYCILFHVIIKRREIRLGYDEPGTDHTFMKLPVRYCSIAFVLWGLLRVAAVA